MSPVGEHARAGVHPQQNRGINIFRCMILLYYFCSFSCLVSIEKRSENGACFQEIPMIIKNAKNIKRAMTTILSPKMIFPRKFQ
jgi:hypothetical protein